MKQSPRRVWVLGAILAAALSTAPLFAHHGLSGYSDDEFEITGTVETPKMLVAEGPISSMAALFLKLYRPDIQIETTHKWSSWLEISDSNIRELVQPAARYLSFPGR